MDELRSFVNGGRRGASYHHHQKGSGSVPSFHVCVLCCTAADVDAVKAALSSIGEVVAGESSDEKVRSTVVAEVYLVQVHAGTSVRVTVIRMLDGGDCVRLIRNLVRSGEQVGVGVVCSADTASLPVALEEVEAIMSSVSEWEEEEEKKGNSMKIAKLVHLCQLDAALKGVEVAAGVKAAGNEVAVAVAKCVCSSAGAVLALSRGRGRDASVQVLHVLLGQVGVGVVPKEEEERRAASVGMELVDTIRSRAGEEARAWLDSVCEKEPVQLSALLVSQQTSSTSLAGTSVEDMKQPPSLFDFASTLEPQQGEGGAAGGKQSKKSFFNRFKKGGGGK